MLWNKREKEEKKTAFITESSFTEYFSLYIVQLENHFLAV